MRSARIAFILSSAMLPLVLGACSGSTNPAPPQAAGAGPQVAALSSVKKLSSGYTLLYSFAGPPNDGSGPLYSHLVNVGGTLYGATYVGGNGCSSSSGCGTVYSITPAGKETVLYSFKSGPSDGSLPATGLTPIGNTLYGTTIFGGTDGLGTVFSITTSGTEAVLHSFAGESGGDGAEPFRGLENLNGTLYGTTSAGGTDSIGTVYSITTSGAESVLHNFTYSEGYEPLDRLVNAGGTLYGTTLGGGSGQTGTVFSITPSGSESVLYNFPEGGGEPSGLVMFKGTLYGVSEYGGANGFGCVYSITTSGQESTVYSFGALPDAQYPDAGLYVLGNKLYGTTIRGGANNLGTIYSVTAAGKEAVLHSFGSGTDGLGPDGSLIALDGVLYGTTGQGGATSNGTVYAYKP